MSSDGKRTVKKPSARNLIRNVKRVLPEELRSLIADFVPKQPARQRICCVKQCSLVTGQTPHEIEEEELFVCGNHRKTRWGRYCDDCKKKCNHYIKLYQHRMWYCEQERAEELSVKETPAYEKEQILRNGYRWREHKTRWLCQGHFFDLLDL